MRLNPQYASQYLTQALTCEGLGKNEDAQVSYARALELDPNNAYYHQLLGLFYLREGRKKEAEVQLQKSKEIKSEKLTNRLLRKLK